MNCRKFLRITYFRDWNSPLHILCTNFRIATEKSECIRCAHRFSGLTSQYPANQHRQRYLNSVFSNFSCTSSITSHNTEHINEATEQKRKSNRNTFRKRCIDRISSTFTCDGLEALHLMKKYPILFYEDIYHTMEKIEILLRAGVSTETIKKNISILNLTIPEMEMRLAEMDKWGLNRSQKAAMIIFFLFSKTDFDTISRSLQIERDEVPYGNRILYISNFLKCPLEKVVCGLKYNDKMLLRNFTDLKNVLETLKNRGVTVEEIQKNIAVLGLDLDKVEQRLEMIENSNVKSIDLSKIRANDNVFKRYIIDGKIENEILKGDVNREQYLSELLKVDAKIIGQIIKNNTKIFNQSLQHIKEITDFLLSEGYTGKQICYVPKIYFANIRSLTKRLEEMRQLGIRKPRLSTLAAYRNIYRKALRRFQQAKKESDVREE